MNRLATRRSRAIPVAARVAALVAALFVVLGTVPVAALAQTDLGVAEYTETGELVYPDNLDAWILMGASLGGDYNAGPFDPANPGVFGVVQMEPNAYRYFLENGEYADGTMFLLSFFGAEAKSEPQLHGFVQGESRGQEIHVIDSERFGEGHGFFGYGQPGGSAAKLPDGSPCIQCHSVEGDYDATFIQFYPAIRDEDRH